MPRETTCPHCNGLVRVPDGLPRDDAVECPLCLSHFVPPAPPRPAGRGAFEDLDDDWDDRPVERHRRGRGYAKDRVAGPAMGLLVIGILGLILLGGALAFGGVALALLAAAPPDPGDPPEIVKEYNETVRDLPAAMARCAIPFAASGLITAGAWQMRRLRSRGLAKAACIVAMIPAVSPCCLFGLAFGIQGVKALDDPDVREAFD